MVVCVFDLLSANAVAAALAPIVLTTDTIFSVIVTFIFLKPILQLVQAARNTVQTAAKRRLERTKRWNFAGLILTVVTSTALYLHLIAFFTLSALSQFSLHRSVLGNIFVVAIPMASMLNIFGMILLCGMFKDTMLPTFKYKVGISSHKGASSSGEPRKELGFEIDSHAYSEHAAVSEDSS